MRGMRLVRRRWEGYFTTVGIFESASVRCGVYYYLAVAEGGGERETPLEVPSSAARLAAAPQSAIVVWWVRLLPVGTARSKRRLF